MMKTRSKTFIYAAEQEWQPAGDGVHRMIMGYDGQVTVALVKFDKPGGLGAPHTHYHSQTSYVASGRFEFTIGDETREVAAGDGVYMEPDQYHGCRCLEPGIVVDCFTPMRADFVEKLKK